MIAAARDRQRLRGAQNPAYRPIRRFSVSLQPLNLQEQFV
jgi:hypothetical protein